MIVAAEAVKFVVFDNMSDQPLNRALSRARVLLNW